MSYFAQFLTINKKNLVAWAEVDAKIRYNYDENRVKSALKS